MTRRPRRASRRGGPLRHGAFRWLLAARTTSILGNAAAPVALAFAVLDLTGSAADLGLVVAARSITNVAVLLFGGVLADRLPRTLVLVGASLAAAATQATVAGLVLTGSATVVSLALLSALNGAVAAVSMPAAAAMVPETVPAELLRPANALLRLGLNAGGIVGAAAGAGIVAAVGPGWGLAVDAAGFALAALLFSRLRLTPPAEAAPPEPVPAARPEPAAAEAAPPEPPPPVPRASVVADLRAGWREFTARRWVWVVVAQFAVLNAAFVGATTILGPVIADATFGRASWGLVIAAQTAGLAAGAVLALRWRPNHALGIGVGLMAVTAVPVAALGIAPELPTLLVAFALGGVALEVFAIAWDQSLQTHIPREALARVYSYDMVGSFVAIPLGEVLVGPLAERFGTEATLIGCATLIVVASLAALSVASVRRLTTPSTPIPDAEPTPPIG
ncbi:MFS transporter [Herbiconiux sp. P18]|uniref:MFS transporter n=1 Tax=Herbiconiux liangxiaofengii TaxID=3342795 RepID=UPI0035B913F3